MLPSAGMGLEVDVHHLIAVGLSHCLDGFLEHDRSVVHQGLVGVAGNHTKAARDELLGDRLADSPAAPVMTAGFSMPVIAQAIFDTESSAHNL
ncbi:hypothetical protein [Mesorhizobium sp. M0220]|uniref:hypothetical protein n=1 Tax=Mesorhizobium sp. M0220 TaxID=2956920 RepID=UPI00333A29C5